MPLLLRYYLALIFVISLTVAGQLLLKAGAQRGGGILEQLMHGYTVTALASYFVAAICYIFALRGIPVSIAFPSVSISTVVFVAIAAHFFWREPFGAQQFVAIILIGTGLFMLFRD